MEGRDFAWLEILTTADKILHDADYYRTRDSYIATQLSRHADSLLSSLPSWVWSLEWLPRRVKAQATDLRLVQTELFSG